MGLSFSEPVTYSRFGSEWTPWITDIIRNDIMQRRVASFCTTTTVHMRRPEPDVEARSPASEKERSGSVTIPPPGCLPRSHHNIRITPFHLLCAFLAGVLAQFLLSTPFRFSLNKSTDHPRPVKALASPYAESTERHNFPPTSPLNAHPTLFPSDVGYAGGTPTGAEPAVLVTAPAYPLHTGAAQLVPPETLGGRKASESFDLFKSWGTLSPWYSVNQSAFGLKTSPGIPNTCRVTGLHLLHRHGARYPTDWVSFAGPAKLASRLNQSPEKWRTTGDLEFLNKWTYKLGEELLTPFGRQQLYDLGISMRMKYGFLLKNFTESNTLPVFRTTSQDRMLKSALNFALGFFGYPFEGQYQQSITLEAPRFNNTLAPWNTCSNDNDPSKGYRGAWYFKKWVNIYLADALTRLSSQISGFTLTIEDIYSMQEMCAYETVSLGYSRFCQLFTENEWKGFNYASDLSYWYNYAFGAPLSRAQGIGYVHELIARLTHSPIITHNTSTNSTLDDDPITFPLGQSLYVDATHETVVLNIITALNLTHFASAGPLPYDRIPENHTFRVSELAPLATNVQFQLLECHSVPGQQIRIIINDGVAPLTGIKGCPEQSDGMCPVDVFVAAQKETIADADWDWSCHGDWEIPEGPTWHTTTGSPPSKPNRRRHD